MGKKWVMSKLSEAKIVHFFGAWHPDGNISSSELEKPESDEPVNGVMSCLNDDYNVDIQLFAMQSVKMQAEANRRSIQGPLGIEKIKFDAYGPET